MSIMSMRIALFSALCALFVFVGLPLQAQESDRPPNNTAVLFEGTSLRGSFRPLKLDSKKNGSLSRMSAASGSVFPGVELRFNQNGRLTIGVGYQYWKLDGPPWTDLMAFCLDGKFCPVSDPSSFITRHPQTGEPLASGTKDPRADAKVLSSTAYINLWMRGRIRPFVALGGGVALIKETTSITTFVHPEIEDVIGHPFRFEKPEQIYSRNIGMKPVATGLVGVNIFPGAHTMVSLSGGYSSGTVLNLKFGFVF